MNYETVTFDVRPNGIATMTLNRPKQLNCFTQKMFQEWSDVISKCAYDKNVKVLVITGAGENCHVQGLCLADKILKQT